MDSSKIVSLTIIETIHYGATLCFMHISLSCPMVNVAPYDPDGETGDLTAWLQDEASSALRLEDVASGLLSEVEHDSGEVQGQDWEWEF